MSWAQTFNANNPLANSLSGAMSNIKLSPEISKGEIQTKIGRIQGKDIKNEDKDTVSFSNTNPIKANDGAQKPVSTEGLNTYSPSAPVINRNYQIPQNVNLSATQGSIQNADTKIKEGSTLIAGENMQS